MSEKEAAVTDVTFLVIGGGIAGVTCAEHLAILGHRDETILLTSSAVIKAATNVRKLTRGVLEEFNVVARRIADDSLEWSEFRIVQAAVTGLDSQKRLVFTDTGSIYRYRKLCVCSGGIPKVIGTENPHVIGIRDTDTAKDFETRLRGCHRLLVVGNGGIATELAHEVSGCQVVWAVKNDSIGATFFDAGAAHFLLSGTTVDGDEPTAPVKRMRYRVDDVSQNQSDQISRNHPPSSYGGPALGPDWARNLNTKGTGKASRDLHIEYNCDVLNIFTPEEFATSGKVETELPLIKENLPTESCWSVYVELSNGNVIGCDFVVSATGVIPNVTYLLPNNSFDVADDGGLKVDEFLRTTVDDVYAAGDACSANWEVAPHWFQMRLWTQARQSGAYAARSMHGHLEGEVVLQDFCFELFTHVTRFFGFKVILLGLFNGQGLGTDYEILLRVTKGVEFVKVVMQHGRMQGAILIGETDLEETFENLILNQMDLSRYGEDLLNPDIDIEDYFD